MSSQSIAVGRHADSRAHAGRRLTGSSSSTAWLLGGLFLAFRFVSVAIALCAVVGLLLSYVRLPLTAEGDR